jgi:hypothetical protein
MNWTKVFLTALLSMALLWGGVSVAQEEAEKPSSQAQESQTPGGAVDESYLKEQRRKQILEPYQPGRVPGMPSDYDSSPGGLTPRSGSSMGRIDSKPLPSLLDPLERRKKRLRKELDFPDLPQSGSAKVAPRPDLGTSRYSREGVYKVSYTGGKPNSYGLPFSWQVKVQDKNGLPIKGAHLSLRMSMPKSGHSPVITGMAVRELDKGLYKISGIRCDRAGLWRAVLEVHGRGYGDTVTFNLIVP